MRNSQSYNLNIKKYIFFHIQRPGMVGGGVYLFLVTKKIDFSGRNLPNWPKNSYIFTYEVSECAQ